MAEDTTQPGVYLECFVDSSWLEHLRLHERVTEDERRLQDEILLLLTGTESPRVRHFVGGAPDAPVRQLRKGHNESGLR